jgi:hypothetical protein
MMRDPRDQDARDRDSVRDRDEDRLVLGVVLVQ